MSHMDMLQTLMWTISDCECITVFYYSLFIQCISTECLGWKVLAAFQDNGKWKKKAHPSAKVILSYIKITETQINSSRIKDLFLKTAIINNSLNTAV